MVPGPYHCSYDGCRREDNHVHFFPDADTERAVRLGASWPGSIEDDMAALPADRAFETTPDTRPLHVHRGEWCMACIDHGEHAGRATIIVGIVAERARHAALVEKARSLLAAMAGTPVEDWVHAEADALRAALEVDK